MPVGVLYEADGFGERDYEAVNEALRDGEASPDGLVVHIAGPSAHGWRVMELWESAESLRAFRSAHLDPAFDRAGVARVVPEVMPVHTVLPPVAALASVVRPHA